MSENLEKRKSYIYKIIENLEVSLTKNKKLLDEAINNNEGRKIEVYSTRVDKTKERINSLQSQLMYMREDTKSDLEERQTAQALFGKEVSSIVPNGVPLVFHGNNDIATIYEILKSGGLKTPEEKGVDFRSFATQIDVANKHDIHVPLEFAEPGIDTCRPYGAIFVFYPKKHEIEKGLGKFGTEVPGGVESIDFKEDDDRFVAIITTEENKEKIQIWLKEFGMDEKKVFTHLGFIEMCKERYKERENDNSSKIVENELAINSDELRQMKILGRGACSIVYKYGEDRVIKILNQSGMQMHNEEQFTQLMNINSQLCVFPDQKVQVDGNFQGYIMEFVKGEQLQDVVDKIDLETLIGAIKNAELDIRSLAQYKVFFQDLNQGGIMWDEKIDSIKIIDTDFFEVNQEFEEEECFNANMRSFNTMLEMELGIMSGQAKGLAKYLHTSQYFSDTYKKYILSSLMGKESSVVDLIEIAREVIKKDFGVVPQNLAEMRELVGEYEIDVSDIPTFLSPEQQVGTQLLGKQVITEISDILLTDETQNEIDSQEEIIKTKKER